MRQAISPSRGVVILIGLTFALVLPCLRPGSFGETHLGLPPLIGREIAWWVLSVIILIYTLVVERKPLSSLGFRPPDWKTVAYAVGAVVTIYVFVGGMIQFVFPIFHWTQNLAAQKQLGSTPYLYRVFLVLRAAFGEELLMRGYGITRLEELTGNKWIAGLVTLAVFSIAHLSTYGWTQVLVAGATGLVLTALFLWRRDLLSNMLTHWIVDALSVLTH